MIVTIDGSAGSGKSTAAHKLAARLDIAYLDTGAMYRALAYQMMDQGVSLSDPSAMLKVARHIDMSVECSPRGTRVVLEQREVSDAIRSMAVTRAASAVALVQPIRDLMVHRQRAIGASLGSLVSEGRDQGSVVFPRAEVKFVIEAAVERRAQRRLEELRADGQDVTLEEVVADVMQRDAQDAVQWQALLKPGAAIRIDTTSMPLAEVVDRLEACVRERCGDRQPPA